MQLALKNRKFSDEHRLNLSKALSGRKFTEEQKLFFKERRKLK